MSRRMVGSSLISSTRSGWRNVPVSFGGPCCARRHEQRIASRIRTAKLRRVFFKLSLLREEWMIWRLRLHEARAEWEEEINHRGHRGHRGRREKTISNLR